MITETLPLPLYRASQVRELDRIAIEDMGIPAMCLMERAGAASFKILQQEWPQAQRIIVLCGTGNNGGDGYVIARLAYIAGYDVTVLQLGNTENLTGEAYTSYNAMTAVGLFPQAFTDKKLSVVDLVVDALLGIGLDRTISGKYREVIQALNRRRCPVLSVDIPSGLSADTGAVLGMAVRANVTVSFIGLKQGLFTGEGAEYSGKIYFDDLNIPPSIYKRVKSKISRLDNTLLPKLLPKRSRTAHKGSFGSVLVVGGETGMTGAVRLAAQAAARIGAGKVSIATRVSHAPFMNLDYPEIMCHGIEMGEDLFPLLDAASVIAIGPGLGQSIWAREMLETVKNINKPIVIDADALNLLANAPFRVPLGVLTPHPMEAARLLEARDANEIQDNRFEAVQSLQLRFGGVIVLKGAGTLVSDDKGYVNIANIGNPGMACGGMGDILTGVIAGLLAQGLAPNDAAKVGVYIHGKAGDKVAELGGERGLLPSDLLPWIRYYANPDFSEQDKVL